MRNLATRFEIPDPKRPFAGNKRGLVPSGELIPLAPPPLDPRNVLGRTVREISAFVGTYGMGGPGFFGLRIDNDEWLVISLWGAAEWILVDDRLISDIFGEKYDRPKPWMSSEADTLALEQRLVGSSITALDIRMKSLDIRFSSGSRMVIDETSARRPILEGSREPRVLLPDEDLRQAVFMSPTTELWV